RERRGIALDGPIEPREASGNALEVVGIVRADRELDEPPARRAHEDELLAAVGGGEAAVADRDEPELLGVSRRGSDVRNTEASGGEAVECHGSLSVPRPRRRTGSAASRCLRRSW